MLGHNWEDPRELGYRSPTLSEESDGAGDYIGLGILTAAIYLAMAHAASLGARALERRLRT